MKGKRGRERGGEREKEGGKGRGLCSSKNSLKYALQNNTTKRASCRIITVF